MISENYQQLTGGGKVIPKTNYYLRFENDGETEILDADWEWSGTEVDDKPTPNVFNNPFPLAILPPGGNARVSVIFTWGSQRDGLSVRTSWRHPDGQSDFSVWPVTL